MVKPCTEVVIETAASILIILFCESRQSPKARRVLHAWRQKLRVSLSLSQFCMRLGRRGVGHNYHSNRIVHLPGLLYRDEAHSANAFNSAHACMQGRRKIRCGDGGAGLPRSRVPARGGHAAFYIFLFRS